MRVLLCAVTVGEPLRLGEWMDARVPVTQSVPLYVAPLFYGLSVI